MHRGRALLGILLIVLFSGFSFDAYACKLPFGGHQTAMDAGCLAPGQQPAPRVCEVFKTLMAQSGIAHDPVSDASRLCLGSAAAAISRTKPASCRVHLLGGTPDDPPCVLPLNVVLRI